MRIFCFSLWTVKQTIWRCPDYIFHLLIYCTDRISRFLTGGVAWNDVDPDTQAVWASLHKSIHNMCKNTRAELEPEVKPTRSLRLFSAFTLLLPFKSAETHRKVLSDISPQESWQPFYSKLHHYLLNISGLRHTKGGGPSSVCYVHCSFTRPR